LFCKDISTNKYAGNAFLLDRRVLAWALYDLANTIFSMNVVSVYFPLWVTVTLGREDLYVSFSLAMSMIFLIVTGPVAGAHADRTGRKYQWLTGSILVCAGATVTIGWTGGLIGGITAFILANYSYQLSLIFYDAYLPEISNNKNIGRISGLGVFLGYIGTIIGLLAVKPLVPSSAKNAVAFPFTAFLFLLFSMPAIHFLRPIKRCLPRQPQDVTPLTTVFSTVFTTLRNAGSFPGLLPYLISHLLYLEAINTIVAFMAIYAVKVVGFSQEGGEVTRFFIIATVFAAIGSIGWGYLTDRYGPRATLHKVLWLWMLTLGLVIASHEKSLFWFVGALAGVALGGVWTSDRPLLLTLTPPEKTAEFFGLYYLTGKFAAIVGPILWGTIVYFGHDLGIWRYRIAVSVLLGFVMAALLVLRKVPDRFHQDTSWPKGLERVDGPGDKNL